MVKIFKLNKFLLNSQLAIPQGQLLIRRSTIVPSEKPLFKWPSPPSLNQCWQTAVSLKFSTATFWVKLLNLNLFIRKTVQQMINQAGKLILSANQFAWYPALNETPGHTCTCIVTFLRNGKQQCLWGWEEERKTTRDWEGQLRHAHKAICTNDALWKYISTRPAP